MKMQIARAWLVKMLMTATMVSSMALCGCESEDTDEDITSTRFFVERELVNYSDTDEFTWDTTQTEALVTIRINDYREGDTSLRVYDGRGDLIFIRELDPEDAPFFNGDDLFVQQRTESGQPGVWRIVAGYDDFTGDISITLE